MSTISAKKLNEALSKAKNVGLVEESFVIEGCDLSLRNLRPDEYAAVLQDCQGLEDMAYFNAYQKGHLCRSIVVLNGVDLHDSDFVEVEEEDPKKPGQTKVVKLELHAFLAKYVLATWSKEAIYTAYRKFAEVLELAERKAKEGITFILPEETDEEKYRRLLLEAKECEATIPDTLVVKILEDIGLAKKQTAEEIKSDLEGVDRLAREQAESEAVEPESVVASPEPTPEPPTEPVRQPMNRAPRSAVDPHQTFQQAVAARQQVTQPVVQPQQAQPDTSAASRAAKIAALEADVGSFTQAQGEPVTSLPGPDGKPIPVVTMAQNQPQEAVELRQQAKFDSNAAQQILDKPPVAGINPRFKPAPRF